MKTLLSFLLMLMATAAFSQTQITSSTVSGTWTTAGSPYIINNAVSVNAGSSLTIQPGVVVRFKATTKMVVTGSLIANGTAAQKITFQADDTTGWANESITAGGWHGIHFMTYSGSGVDNSVLNFCILKDTKYGYNSAIQNCNTLTIYRKLKVSNTEIYHNTAGTGFYVAGDNISISTNVASDTVEFDRCTIYDNTSVFGIIHTSNYSGGYTHIHNCEFYDNIKGSPIWGTWNNILIEANDIHHNEMINDSAPIKMTVGNGRIVGNKVRFNICDQLAAIGCRSGFFDIDNNLICNNQQMDGNCGATGGGGGIHLSYNEGATTFALTYYRVRNNVIANNYSAYGGGGIYVFTARAEISNNTIANNTSGSPIAKGIMVLNPQAEVYIKNNILTGNGYPGMTDSTYAIGVYSANKISCDNNYMPTNYSHAVYGIGNFTLIGDTIHNVIGSAPQFIAPTANNAYTTDATTANFGITTTSPCVDKGDSTGVNALPTDYIGNQRIQGSKIDIGAYEVIKSAEWVNDVQASDFPITMYPNPAVSEVNLILPFTHSTVTISDINGHQVFSQTLNSTQTQIRISDWANGIYIVRCASEGKMAIRRLVVTGK
ncbi:MAG: T9SS type A sorting domain-containing protein [Chitinophagaceae bacterium]|nr:T9SS type A sorting domain-containing protein [Chitinophagaceae bacterium]